MKNNPTHPQKPTLQNITFDDWEAALKLANAAPHCGAKTRSGHPCKSPAMGNGRCRMHGGKSPGAPYGNRHAYKTGAHIAELHAIRQLLRESKNILEDLA